LPDFLRDVAEAGRFGMTLAQAIRVSSRGRYGRLTPEIQRMAAQIDWGVPASEALRLFAERVNTPLVKRMVSIIIKANDAGGSVADVLTMVAHDARETIINFNERRISMATYTVVIYVAFGVFLATIFILNTTFLPNMEEAGQQVNEQALEAGVTNLPATIQSEIIPTVQLIFIVSVAIHAFGDGILAGVLQDGKIANGLRHSFIMLLIGFLGTILITG
jgi:flagellar protein FlaJ